MLYIHGYYIMLYISPQAEVEPTTLVVIGTDCIGSCNYHTITTMTAQLRQCKTYLENIHVYKAFI
jgi:hypothetical protein